MKALKHWITQVITTVITLTIMGVLAPAYSAPYYAPYPSTTDMKNLDQGSQQIAHVVVLDVTISGVHGMGFYTWKLVCPPGAHDGIKIVDVRHGPGCWILDGNLPDDLGLLDYWPMPTLDASLTLSSNTLSCTWATLSIHGCMAIGTYPVPTHNFFSGYDAATGYLSESRPVWGDIDPATTPTSAAGYGISHGSGLDAWTALLAPSTPSIPYHSGTNGAANLTLGSGLNLTAGTLDANMKSFNARTGAVVSATNDYSFSQISGTITPSQLPTATSTTIGAVFTPPIVTPPHNFIYGYSAGWLEKQPVWNDIDNSTTPTTLAGYAVVDGAALDALGTLFASSTPSIPYHSGTGGAANLTLGSGLNLTAGTLDANIKSFNSRTGAVVPVTNDYTFAQIGSKPTTLSGYGITDAEAASTGLTALAGYLDTGTLPQLFYKSGLSGISTATVGTGLNFTAGTLAVNWISPALTGSPTAPTQTTSDNSTLVATDAFVKNQAYAPLASPTFTGTVSGAIAAWSGNETTLGSFGIGTASPAADFDIEGTYTSSNSAVIKVAPTVVSSATGTQFAFQSQPTFNPSGASLSLLYGGYFRPRMSGSSSMSIGTVGVVTTLPEQITGYSGTIANLYEFYAQDALLASGTNPITAFSQFYSSGSTNGNGITSGTIANYGFRGQGSTASAASGGVVQNYNMYFTLGTGSGAGSTTNFGLRITGNGGTPIGGGSTANYAVYDDSTAPAYFQGSVGVGLTSPAYKMDVVGDINASGGLREAGVLISGKYAPATSGTSILKGNGSGGFSNAVANTDYLPISNPLFTGTLNGGGTDTSGTTVNRSGSSSNTALANYLETSTAQYNLFGTRVNTHNRWAFGASNATESGSNVGSNFTLNRYTDAGAFIDSPFNVERATGIAHISNGVEIDVGTVTFFPTRPTDTIAQIIGTNGTNPGIIIDGYGGSPNYYCRRADQNVGVPSAVQNNDMLCNIGGRGFGATDYSTNSRVYTRYFAGENWTDTAQGTYTTWGETPPGTITTTEYMRLTSAALNIGTDVKTTGTIPTLSTCGTSPTIRSGSTDTSGEITEGTTAAGCTITFASAKTNIPFCVVTSQTQLAAFTYVLSTTAITITMTVTSGNKINYHCTQN